MLATLSSLSRSALLAILGALPPVDFPAVCLVRAMLLLLLCVVLLALAVGTTSLVFNSPFLSSTMRLAGARRN